MVVRTPVRQKATRKGIKMLKISAEKYCRKLFPKSIIENRKTNGHETYYLIRETRMSIMPISEGKSKKEAWEKLRETCILHNRQSD